ncbi:MAG: asparagine synthase (glutamine-hydrolyzing) [Cellvibrionaceae bacterium]
MKNTDDAGIGEEFLEVDAETLTDWQLTLADNDLRKVSHTTALAGAEVFYPLLDDELVEMSCRVPVAVKLKSSDLRYFFKESLRGWLPEEAISKKKHGFGLPFGVWMRTDAPLREMAYDTLLQLKKRHYFRPEFIDRTISLHRDGHASYYGELIWILVTVELWMSNSGSL